MTSAPHEALEARRAWLGFRFRLVGKRGGLDMAWGSCWHPRARALVSCPSHRAALPTLARTGGPLLMTGPASGGDLSCVPQAVCPHG